MSVPVMEVGIVRVFVPKGRVVMPVGVRLAGRIVGAVGVLVMLVVDVAMLMVHRLMQVVVFVLLGQMQIDAQRHEDGGGGELRGDRLTKQDQ